MARVAGQNLQNTHHLLTPADAESVLRQCLQLLVALRECGLVHGDLNEFNLMVEFPPLPQYAHSFKEEPCEEDFDAYRSALKR